MNRVEFVWDERKALGNRSKHGISFDGARLAFDDPNGLYEQDRVVAGEVRWRLTGWAAFTMLTVTYVNWDEDDGTEVYRIISARPATRAERQKYEEAT